MHHNNVDIYVCLSNICTTIDNTSSVLLFLLWHINNLIMLLCYNAGYCNKL